MLRRAAPVRVHSTQVRPQQRGPRLRLAHTSRPSQPLSLKLYSKRECSLCEEAKHTLLIAQNQIPFKLEEVDIKKEGNEKWHDKYLFDIPVVTHGDTEIFRHRVELSELIAKLKAL